jgi:alpha-glucosidase
MLLPNPRLFLLSLSLGIVIVSARDEQVWKLNSLSGPNANLTLSDGSLSLSIIAKETLLMTATSLGLRTTKSDFTTDLTFSALSTERVTGSYEMLTGKSLSRTFEFEESLFSFSNPQNETFGLRIRLSKDGVAFAYELPDLGDNSIHQETAQWTFPGDGKAYLMTSVSTSFSVALD